MTQKRSVRAKPAKTGKPLKVTKRISQDPQSAQSKADAWDEAFRNYRAELEQIQAITEEDFSVRINAVAD